MNKRNKKNTLPSLVQKYQAESVILEIQSVLKSYNIDMFLCIRDQKTQCVEAISTDHEDFGLKDVGALILNKKVAFMNFNEYEDLTPTIKPILEEPEEALVEEQKDEEKEEKIVEDEAQEQISNESSFDSKKLTNASTLNEQISEVNSGAEIKSDITFDDQMSTQKFEAAEPSVMSVESPKVKKEENHDQPQIYFGEQNYESEQPLPRFVPLNESCYETVEYAEPEACSQHYRDASDSLSCRASRFSASTALHASQSQDFGISISQKRCDFAQKYLFKSGFQNNEVISETDSEEEESEMDDEDYSENEYEGEPDSSPNDPVLVHHAQAQTVDSIPDENLGELTEERFNVQYPPQ